MAKVTLESWIHEAMTDTDKEKEISAFTLMHMVGQGEREIHTCRLGSKQWLPRDLGNLFRHKAQVYCQELPGVQTFNLLAFYGSDEPQASHPFTMQGETDLHQLTTEGPDEKGLRMQGMRHVEAITQLNHRSIAHVLDTMSRMNETLLRENLEVRRENREGFALMKEMMAQQALGRHEYKMKELEYERSSSERKKWLEFAPSLVNSILGTEVFPQSTEDTALLETIANSLSEEDLLKLGSILKPEILGPISARFEKVFKAKQLKSAAEKRQLSAKNPEDDAAGD